MQPFALFANYDLDLWTRRFRNANRTHSRPWWRNARTNSMMLSYAIMQRYSAAHVNELTRSGLANSIRRESRSSLTRPKTDERSSKSFVVPRASLWRIRRSASKLPKRLRAVVGTAIGSSGFVRGLIDEASFEDVDDAVLDERSKKCNNVSNP